MVHKKIHYSKTRPVADRLAYYKGKLYLTKEDLKTFPETITLIPISR